MSQEQSAAIDAKKNVSNGNGTSREQSGFGDTLASTERKTYASFIPFCQDSKMVQLNTSVNFTPYSEESSSCNISSKLDDDVMTLNSDDEVPSARKQESDFEVSELDVGIIYNRFSLLKILKIF